MPQPASDGGERAREHGAEMGVPVVVERIEQILHVQAGVGVALDRELALEEERVRVLGAGGKLDELGQIAADAHGRLLGRHRHEPVADDAEGHARAGVCDVDGDGPAVELAQAFGERLAAHQMIEGLGEELRVHDIRHEPERDGEQGFEGVHQEARLLPQTVRDPLIWIKPRGNVRA